jgi:tight adherence protein C
MTILLPLLAFLFGALLVTAAGFLMMPTPAASVQRRLEEVVGTRVAEPEARGEERLVRSLKKLGEKMPKSPRELGKLRQRLVASGYRRDGALAYFLGVRALVALGAFSLFALPVFIRPNLAVAAAGLGFGYLVPGMVLGRQAGRRQHRIRLALADALDLLVVSVEAGLGLDQAIQRVADELQTSHPDLADELRLVNLEMRAGKARAEALRNLADRTGLEDLSALVAMLVQTDKFGTSIARSLRVFSDTLRTKRRQRAEEAAAKTGVKMVFPLVFCIFPAIWIVTIGPAAIKFITVLFPVVENTR